MLSFPFDSYVTYDEDGTPSYDRAVSSQPLRTIIRKLFSSGVMPNPSTNLQVSAGVDGMTVIVSPGFAVVDGGLCKEDNSRTLSVTAADATLDRIDTVILRWNENVDVRTADLYIKAGTPAETPIRPTLERDESIYEIGLADVFITHGVATITNDKITDTRYESERCGIVSSVSEWDTTTIYQQVQADLAAFKSGEETDFDTWMNAEMSDFETWVETIHGILDDETAGHLQLEIEAIQNSMVAIEECTEEEYEALTPAEKMDGKIRIVGDQDGQTSAAVIKYDNTESGMSARNVQSAIDEIHTSLSYHTTETKIGKLGNDDLYRRIYYSDNANITATTVIDATLNSNSIKQLVDMKYVEYVVLGNEWNTQFRANVTNWDNFPRIDSNGLKLMVTGTLLDTITKYTIIVEYTKN